MKNNVNERVRRCKFKSKHQTNFFNVMTTRMSSFDIESIAETDNDKPCLKICDPLKGNAKYFKSDFVDVYWEYMNDKFENEDYETDSDNHIQALNALNILYLDLDYVVPADTENIVEENKQAAYLYRNIFIEENNLTPDNVFMFIPCEFTPDGNGNLKCGAHIFIIMKRNISKDERKTMYSKVKNAILNDNDAILSFQENGVTVDSASFAQVFDYRPLFTANTLLPFAVKVGATRNYRLINIDEIIDSSILVLPTKHNDQTIEKSDDEIEEIEDEMSDIDFDDVAYNATVMKETLKFISSLRYLCAPHPFWKTIADHNQRLDNIIKPLFHWLVLSQFIQDSYNLDDVLKRTTLQLARALLPLIVMTNETKVENKFSKLYTDIKGVCWRPYDDGGAYEYLLSADYARAIAATKDKNDTNVPPVITNYCKRRFGKDVDPKVVEDYIRGVLKIRNCARNIFANYSIFIESIMENLTEEIHPFSRLISDDDIINKGRRHTTNLRNETAWDYYLWKDIYSTYNFDEYENVIRRWFRMFICMTFYTCLDPFNSIRTAISSLVSHFAFQKTKGKEIKYYIYNKRQTKRLCRDSFNQWILDPESNALADWFSIIYETYIRKELQTNRQMILVRGFMDMLKMLQPRDIPKNKDLLPLNDLAKDLKRIGKNILTGSYINNDPPKELPILDDSPYFPMRNGILEFITKESERKSYAIALGKKAGDIIFHYNNYHHYMESTTNVYYDESYSFSNPVYKRIVQLFEEIYDNEDVRKYVLMCFAQVLHSIGDRDQIHQYYGTGGEGKSLINNAIAMMLGCAEDQEITTKFTQGFSYPIGMRDETVHVSAGLAGSMDARALMTENKSSHDSGGLAEMMNRRFITIAEPNAQAYGNNLNVSAAKRVTGANIMTIRKIYKEAEVIIAKAYLTVQTNEILGYSEDNPAIRRRFAVILHNSKFVSESLMDEEEEGRRRRVQYKRADTSLNDKFRADPAYWQALFYVLLPYAQEFIRCNIGGLADVKKPDQVQRMFDISREKSSGLVGWMAKNFVKSPGAVWNVDAFIEHILAEDARGRNTDNAVLDASIRMLPSATKRDRIASVLTARFGNWKLFKLRQEFWKNNTTLYENAKVPDIEDESKIIELERKNLTSVETDNDIDQWFEKVPLSNLAIAGNLKGVYIIDHDFITEERNDEE